ncbi:hypothetical protein NIBR502772_07740 [Pseudarthrobacter sp. NIBRBAC000502772]|uniref:hypothetical protein n=1 Tax=Pseudarthrobacter sp. NIBRBAC000502772 TaxID=2590775 RepID=UPI001131744A|nr:hypothetical protein [Pseudarthrobacter sp. NIBRBAC000502772]QDG66115.1 hypothetical protein NIBR502772_07740 [Pseudarthrobacter sp. NIBRBAC000502772]
MAQDEVRGRIEAFVADFHTRWQRSGKSPGMFASAPGVFEGELSSSPAHDRSAEQTTVLEVTEYLGYRHI